MAAYIGKAVTTVQNNKQITVTGDVNFNGMLNNDDIIDEDVTIAAGRNAAVIGPVTISAAITINGTLTVV